MIRRPPSSSLFLYTTLFRSVRDTAGDVCRCDNRRMIQGALDVLELLCVGGHHVAYARAVPPPGGAAGDPRTISFREGFSTRRDRKSTRLNSSHSQISYAVFC